MTDVRAKTREARLAAALRANLARRKALVRALDVPGAGAPEDRLDSAGRAGSDRRVDGGDELL
ncbi:hypothetical protein [Polymorphobacter sp.]|uniref:hypothetical protein n=1 Tax=Polymorphobacter sp. TaxID=1909290 RepID=UPI003F6F6541